MKLRITEKGFEHMTGPIAEVMFVDGVSVEEVSMQQAQRISCAMRCETLEGVNPSVSAMLVSSHEDRAEVVSEMERADAVKEVEEAVMSPEADAPANVWTREQLEEIADKGGIKALRAIADEFDVKDNSIKGLIEETLKAQAAKQANEKKE